MREELIREYQKSLPEIKKRLKEFEAVWNKSNKKIFSELCFCLCTPQSNAIYCNQAISELCQSGRLFNGGFKDIRSALNRVRFPNNKARFIIEARKLFTKTNTIKVKDKINPQRIAEARLWLVENVKGLGMKEASHFLRNIGLGRNLAILDVHILKNMVKYDIINKVPKSISKSMYLDLEKRLRRFSDKVNIPMAELDLLFWSLETGRVFK